jgi:hypothetical protein
VFGGFLQSRVICFITVAGFLNGSGFQGMRDYLRRTADEIWVINCSSEGHQPEVNTRVFQGVQQPICIVIVSRSSSTRPEGPAKVFYYALPAGHRQEKFAALGRLTIEGGDWSECGAEYRAPFLPRSEGAWATYPTLDSLFVYQGTGVMIGRTWVNAPDVESLQRRWRTLVQARSEQKEDLFFPHLRHGRPADKHSRKVVTRGLRGNAARPISVADERGDCIPPMPYGFRSFDRQWIIPDNRLINQPNPTLWECYSEHQLYLTAPADRAPTGGPALTFTAHIPDAHHYNGRGGRVFPLWSDRQAQQPNLPPGLLGYLGHRYQRDVSTERFMAYIAAVAAHPDYVARFASDLLIPGLRIPITADGETFAEAVELGRTVIWLHTFGERFSGPRDVRPTHPPRLPRGVAPRTPAAGAISPASDENPSTIEYDAADQRLKVGQGYVENVSQQMWDYEVSGKHVLRQWFSYRSANRERPMIGDRRPPSILGDIQPDHWLAEYTTELINLLNVLGLLIGLEPGQADLLDRICSGSTITNSELREAGALEVPAKVSRRTGSSASEHPKLFD